MRSGAQGSVLDLERGGGGAGQRLSPLTQRNCKESRKQGAECFSQVCHRCLPQAQLYTLRSGWNITQFTGHSISQAKLLALPTLPSLCFPSPWMPPVPQTSASRSLGITCRPHPRHTSQAPLVQFTSVVQSCPTLCDPMNHSTPSLPVHHQLPESTQTHVHQVDDAIQPSHSRSSPSPPALILSQHQGLFQWVSSSH